MTAQLPPDQFETHEFFSWNFEDVNYKNLGYDFSLRISNFFVSFRAAEKGLFD